MPFVPLTLVQNTCKCILKHFKNATLDKCQFLPENQIIPVIGNEMVKSAQLACIRYKNQNVLA